MQERTDYEKALKAAEELAYLCKVINLFVYGTPEEIIRQIQEANDDPDK